MANSVVVSGARTPIGKLSGALRSFKAFELGALAMSEALIRSTLPPELVDYVVLGHVLQAGQGQGSARQAAVAAGIPMNVPSFAVNKVCLSGLQAIHLADMMIQAGEVDVVVAGGMESMTNAPYLLPNVRAGLRFGDSQVLDVITVDGLTCAFENVLMGAATEIYASKYGITREDMDQFAAASHERATQAMENGRFDKEIVPISVPQGRAKALTMERDEGIRPDATIDSLSALQPAFSAKGEITAGNASQISDGAAAIVVTSAAVADRLGFEPLAEIVAYGQVAGPDPSLLTQPSRAIMRAVERSGYSLSKIDLFEINEAFAAVAIASIRDLSITADIVNVNGGAIALGHPVGMTGARLVLTLCSELKRRGGGLGAVALCGGGGQGDAMLLNVRS